MPEMQTRRALLFTPLALAADPRMAMIPGGTFRLGTDRSDIERKFPKAGHGLLSMLEAEPCRRSAWICER